MKYLVVMLALCAQSFGQARQPMAPITVIDDGPLFAEADVPVAAEAAEMQAYCDEEKLRLPPLGPWKITIYVESAKDIGYWPKDKQTHSRVGRSEWDADRKWGSIYVMRQSDWRSLQSASDPKQ